MKSKEPLADKYDIIIIGSGCGGSAAAALASFHGYRTLLLEQKSVIGGRANTRERDGFKLDHGHIVLRGERGPHTQVLRMVNCQDLIPKYALLKNLRYRTMFLDQRWDYSKETEKGIVRTLRRNIKNRNVSVSEIPGLILLSVQLKMRAMREKDNWKGSDRVSARSMLLEYTDNEAIDIGLAALTSGCFGVLSDQASCGEWIRTTQEISRDDCIGYPINGEGISAIPKSLIRSAERLGATVVLKAPVERIEVSEGKVTGVSVEGKRICSDIVISNAGIKETAFKLVGKRFFDQAYIEYLENLTYASSVISLQFALNKPIVEFDIGVKVPKNFYQNIRNANAGRVPDETMMILICSSNIDPLLAPKGKQVLLVTSHCPAVEPGRIDWRPWIESTKRQVEDFVPGISKYTIFCDVSSPNAIAMQTGRIFGDAMGVAQTIDQVGDNTPPLVSPIKGLYHVGADVCSNGVGTEKATQSAIELIKRINP
jgi:phytoene dehydrogenase-like protein